MRTVTKRSGFSLLEACLGMSLLCLLMTGALAGMNDVAQHYGQEYTLQRLEERTRHAVSSLRDFLTEAGKDTLNPPPSAPLGADTLDFRRVSGFEAGAPLFGADQRIMLELDPQETDNGLDDDGDGLIDECQIVFIRDVGMLTESRLVVSRNLGSYLEGELANGIDDNGNNLVDERGLSLELIDDNKLRVRLTIEARSAAQKTIRRTATAVIHLRN